MQSLSTFAPRGVLVATLAGAAFGFSASADADLIAYWHFNSTEFADPILPADVGEGTLDMKAFGGSIASTWPSSGTTENALDGVSAGQAIRFIGTAGNTTSVYINVSMTGFEDLVVSYATNRNAGGYTSQSWAWSVDGSTFNSQQTVSPSLSWDVETIDFSSIADLANADSVTLRLTFDGASAGTGRNQIDNLQIRASELAVPGPAVMSLLVAAGAIGHRGRRRK